MTTNRMGYTFEELRQSIEPGRDGHRQNLNARVLVSGPKEAPRFALFDTSNPIEKMRLRGTLGKDEAETGRRYRAARLWARLHHVASSGAHTCEIVDRVQGSGGGGEIQLFKRFGSWRPDGPSPGQPGCMAPADVLAEFGYSTEEAA